MTIQDSRLYQKTVGCLWAGAVGDALGGPIEGLSYQEIANRYGVVETLLSYAPDASLAGASPKLYGDTRRVGDHGPFTLHAGSYTDDTRLKHILIEAILEAQRVPNRGDFARTIVHRYEHSSSELERGFLEEYALKGIYGGEKLIFAGEPTNGAIMMNSPIGLIHPCDAEAAFRSAYELAFLTDGYAKYSAAAMAAAVASAMNPQATVDSIIADTLGALRHHRDAVEGAHWRETPWRYSPNEKWVESAVEIAKRDHDVFKLAPSYYETLERGPLFSEAAQTLAVALGMFVAADGDLRLTILGAANYGRDNDSYASVAGALAGAFQGLDAIPPDWIETVRSANPFPDIDLLARQLTDFVVRRLKHQKQIDDSVSELVQW